MSIWAEGEAAMPGNHADFSIVFTEALIKWDFEKDTLFCQEDNRQKYSIIEKKENSDRDVSLAII